MENTEPKPSYTRQELREIAEKMLKEGIAPDEVNKFLLAQGLDLNSVYAMVGSLTQGKNYYRNVDQRNNNLVDAVQQRREGGSANKNVIIGGIFFFGGILVTILSMSSGNGGIIAIGAIVFGGIQFFRGLSQND